MMTPKLDVVIQYGENPNQESLNLSQTQVEHWVQTAFTEALAVYSEADMSPPFTHVAFTLRFCDEIEAKQLNKQYRDKDYATNVLTFEYGIDATGTLSGDIVICIAVLEKEAIEQQKPFLHHAAHLCVHGVLHALGYDHIIETDAEDMESLEIDILQQLEIPNPYSLN